MIQAFTRSKRYALLAPDLPFSTWQKYKFGGRDEDCNKVVKRCKKMKKRKGNEKERKAKRQKNVQCVRE